MQKAPAVRKIAIHQPNFLPWLGYFYKLAQCDTFIFYDTAQFSKGSFTNRVYIHARNKDLTNNTYLTVPIKNHPLHTAIKDIEWVSDDALWNTLYNIVSETYRQAPYFHQLVAFLDQCTPLSKHERFLSNFNIALIEHLCAELEIKTTRHLASTNPPSNHATDALIEMIEYYNGNQYLSGHGAKKYMDISKFHERSINIEYSNFKEKFSVSSFEKHLFQKSILSYLAYHSYEEISGFLHG